MRGLRLKPDAEQIQLARGLLRSAREELSSGDEAFAVLSQILGGYRQDSFRSAGLGVIAGAALALEFPQIAQACIEHSSFGVDDAGSNGLAVAALWGLIVGGEA